MARQGLGIILGLALAAISPSVALAQQTPNQPLAYTTFSLSAVGVTPWMPLNGQGACTVSFTQADPSGVVVVQGASDSPNAGTKTPVTVTGIGTNGTISSFSAGQSYGGAVTPQALTFIRLSLTALSAGSVAGSITCSTASGVSSGGGGGGSTNATIVAPIGQKLSANSVSAVLSSDQPTFGVTATVSSPVAASGAIQTTNCDPTTASRCAVVTAGGALTTITTSPYNTGNTGQTAQSGAALQGACQFNTSPVTLTTGQVIGTTCDALGSAYVSLKSGGNIQTVGSGGSANVAICSSGAGSTCVINGGPLQSVTGGSGGLYTTSFVHYATASNNYQVGLGQTTTNGAVAYTTTGGTTTTILTSGSATACTNIKASAGRIVKIINTGAATTVFPQFYNDAATTCSSATLIYGDGSTITIGAGQVITLDMYLSAGLAYKLSGALTANLVITSY